MKSRVISLLAFTVRSSILKIVEERKYFFISLDYISNMSYTKHMDVLAGCVSLSTIKTIQEFFVGL